MRTREEIMEKFKPYDELMWSANNLTDYAMGYYFALKWVLGSEASDE